MSNISERAERRRGNFRGTLFERWTIRLVFIIYGLLIFEGCLRKYAFPQWGKYLFFIRDPFVILLYALALRYKVAPRKSSFLMVGLALAALAFPLMLFQFSLLRTDFDWILALYGWRNYFLYLPLAFFVAKYFPLDQVYRLIRWTLYVSIPIAILVFFQFRAPSTDPINQGFGQTADLQYMNAGYGGGLVRTYGPFTSATGQACFILSGVAMLLTAWMMPKSIRPVKNTVLLLLATGAIFTCVALCGSRGTVLSAAIIVCAAPATLILTSKTRLALRFFVLLVPVLVIGALIVPVAFPQAVDAFAERWAGANVSETELYGNGGIFGRAIFSFFSFRYLIPDTPIQGYQLGLGGNAASNGGSPAIELSSDQEVAGSESDWGRHIVDLGPVFGLIYIGFRVVFSFWLVWHACRAVRRSGDPLPVLLAGFVGPAFLNGQLCAQGTINGYLWLFVGLSMAINFRLQRTSRTSRVTISRPSSGNTAAPALPAPGVPQ